MPRPSKTPQSRSADVMNATRPLLGAVQEAQGKAATFGDDDPRTLAAWDAVEVLGATIHRQSRILAGKSRGG